MCLLLAIIRSSVAGTGSCGELARNAEMAQPDHSGNFAIEPKFLYAFPKTDEEIENQTEEEKAEEKAAMDEFVHAHFMKPDLVKWTLPVKREVIEAAAGGRHLVVVARDQGSWQTKVYASGCNFEGQLGLGDVYNRHALTHVRSGVRREARASTSAVVCPYLTLFQHMSPLHRYHSLTTRISPILRAAKTLHLPCPLTVSLFIPLGAPKTGLLALVL